MSSNIPIAHFDKDHYMNPHNVPSTTTMKTAEEYRIQWYSTELETHEHAYAEMDKLIAQIQLDALKEGMRRAAEVVWNERRNQRHINKQAILTAAEQLTEKDL